MTVILIPAVSVVLACIAGTPVACPSVWLTTFRVVAIVAIGVLVTLAVVLVILLARARSARHVADVATAAAVARASGADARLAAAAAVPQPAFDETLVRQLIEIADLAAGAGLSAAADRALAHLGVVPARAEPGEPFDPRRHLVVSKVPSEDAALADRVDSTVRPGWMHGAELLREVEVAVYSPKHGAIGESTSEEHK